MFINSKEWNNHKYIHLLPECLLQPETTTSRDDILQNISAVFEACTLHSIMIIAGILNIMMC